MIKNLSMPLVVGIVVVAVVVLAFSIFRTSKGTSSSGSVAIPTGPPPGAMEEYSNQARKKASARPGMPGMPSGPSGGVPSVPPTGK